MFGGSGTILGAFGVTLGLDASGYTRGILQADALNQVFGQGVTTFLANPLLGALNAFQAVTGAVIDNSKRVLATAAEYQVLSQRTGVAVETLQALGSAATRVGEDLGLVQGALVTLNVLLGEARAGEQGPRDIFAALGLDPDSIQSTDQALRLVLDRLASIEDRYQAQSLAAVLLGEEDSVRLLQIIGGASDALDGLIERQRRLGQVLDGGTIASLAAANTQLGKLQQALGGVRDVALANFLAGFIDETQFAKVATEDLSGAIIEGLAPAARELGEAIGALVGDLRDADELLTRLGTYRDLLFFTSTGQSPGDAIAIGQAFIQAFGGTPQLPLRIEQPSAGGLSQ